MTFDSANLGSLPEAREGRAPTEAGITLQDAATAPDLDGGASVADAGRLTQLADAGGDARADAQLSPEEEERQEEEAEAARGLP